MATFQVVKKIEGVPCDVNDLNDPANFRRAFGLSNGKVHELCSAYVKNGGDGENKDKAKLVWLSPYLYTGKTSFPSLGANNKITTQNMYMKFPKGTVSTKGTRTTSNLAYPIRVAIFAKSVGAYVRYTYYDASGNKITVAYKGIRWDGDSGYKDEDEKTIPCTPLGNSTRTSTNEQQNNIVIKEIPKGASIYTTIRSEQSNGQAAGIVILGDTRCRIYKSGEDVTEKDGIITSEEGGHITLVVKDPAGHEIGSWTESLE